MCLWGTEDVLRNAKGSAHETAVVGLWQLQAEGKLEGPGKALSLW